MAQSKAFTDASHALNDLSHALALLESENVKLRELARNMALNMGGCALHGNPLRLREFISRAQELGIEVPE